MIFYSNEVIYLWAQSIHQAHICMQVMYWKSPLDVALLFSTYRLWQSLSTIRGKTNSYMPFFPPSRLCSKKPLFIATASSLGQKFHSSIFKRMLCKIRAPIKEDTIDRSIGRQTDDRSIYCKYFLLCRSLKNL